MARHLAFALVAAALLAPLRPAHAAVFGNGQGGADIGALGAISSVAAVPEPGGWALMAAGLAGLGLARHRHRGRHP